MQAHIVPSLEVRPASKAARLATELKSVLIVLHVTGTCDSEKTGPKTSVKRRADSPYGEAEGSGSTKAECHEPDVAFRFARRDESSPDSDSPGAIDAREIYFQQLERSNCETRDDEPYDLDRRRHCKVEREC